MDKMRANEDNVVTLEMDEKVLTEWKAVYKNCKKQRSTIKKDAYDAFVSDIKFNYKNNLKNELIKNRNTIDIEIFKKFFNYVVERSTEYLGIMGTKKESSFYRKERRKAVTDLKVASQEVLSVLGEIEKTNGGNDADVFKKYKINVKKSIKSSAKIKGCIYSYVMDLYGVRLYLVFTLDKFAEAEFNFGEYEMDDKKVVDPNFKSRDIYLVTEKNVNVDIPLIASRTSLKISVYMSPNNIATGALGGFLIGKKWLNVDGEALTKVVLGD